MSARGLCCSVCSPPPLPSGATARQTSRERNSRERLARSVSLGEARRSRAKSGWEAGNLAIGFSSAFRDWPFAAKSFIQCELAPSRFFVGFLPLVAACAGSMSLNMSLAAGALPETSRRSDVESARLNAAALPRTDWPSEHQRHELRSKAARNVHGSAIGHQSRHPVECAAIDERSLVSFA
jgi:hypothetical protein